MPVEQVSFIIRTFNEAAFIGRLFDVLEGQRQVEIVREMIVVDSGSTDSTVAIAKSRGARLLHIPQEQFDYSKALNLGIQNSNGNLVAILSAHSIPCSSDWLRTMLSHFADPRVAGVYCRQLAWPDAHWWESRRVQREFAEAGAVYDRENRPAHVPFSNAASCIRRTVWEQRPFLLPTGEDGEWATWAVLQGHRIVYETRVAVYHSHSETCRQAMRRVIEFEKVLDSKLGRARTVPLTVRQAAGRVVRELREVWNLKNPPQPLSKLAWEAMLRGYWFLMDFRREAGFRSPVRSKG